MLLLQLPKLSKASKSHKPRLNKRQPESPINVSKKKSLIRMDMSNKDSMEDMFSEDTAHYNPDFEYSNKSMTVFEQRKQKHV